MELVLHNAMRLAIDNCHKVDELADLHNKALALELYAKQARDTDAERKACEIRLRAERKAGDLFKDMARTTPASAGAVGGNAKAGNVAPAAVAGASEYRTALESSGVTERTAQRWQELASVPVEQFEDALRAPDKPTTTGIISKAKAAPKMDGDALWVWGRARDFERERFADKNPADLLAGMTDTMRADMERIVPAMAAFFNEFASEVEHERA